MLGDMIAGGTTGAPKNMLAVPLVNLVLPISQIKKIVEGCRDR